MKKYIWKCEICNKVFESKQKLYNHKKEENHYLINNSKFGNVKTQTEIKYACQYCKKVFTTKSGRTLHERSCSLNPNKQPGYNLGKHLSYDTKQKVSLARKKYIKEHGGIWWSSRSKCKKSYAEAWVLKILNNEVQDKEFIEEYHLHKWFMDFAWPKKKIYIEVDGKQHEWEDRKKNDEEKDNYYKSLGWKVLRLPWSYCCSNTQDCIKNIIDFVDNSKVVDINWKSKKEIHNEKLKDATKAGKINSLGRINTNMVSNEEWKNRKNLVLNSGVDLSKFGWVSKVTKATGLSKHQIQDTCKHFNLNVYKTKKGPLV